MRTNRHVGTVTALGALVLTLSGGCDLVANIGTYCVEGVDPGCGTGGAGGTTTSTGAGGTTTNTGAGGTTTSTGGGGIGGGPDCTPPATQDCYAGPDGTKDVGACKGGTQACQADGKWGPCVGQVLPEIETCASAANEDCDNTECALWSLISGDSANQAILNVAVDSAGETIVFGFFAGELPVVQPPRERRRK